MKRTGTAGNFSRRDAVVVGAGPNGLAAAITLAREGYDTLLVEAADRVGGGARSEALTLPGFVHDVCSAVHPMAVLSPFLASLPLERHGLEWIHPGSPLAHPLAGAPAATLEVSLEATVEGLGADGPAWRDLVGPVLEAWDGIAPAVLGPLQPRLDPVGLARFAARALRPARTLARESLAGDRARGLFAGLAAHAGMPLEAPGSAAVGMVLAVAGHAVGWPLPRGGAQRIADALADHLRSLGGEIRTGHPVTRLEDLPPARATLLDLTPRQLLAIAGRRLPAGYRRALARFRYGPGAFKVDWALDGPIPWADPACARAGTVHLGGTLLEIAAAERTVALGGHPEQPFVLLSQPSLFDPGRAPAGRHTAWAYARVPNGSTVDMTERIEARVEAFAPGFRDRILARRTHAPADLERHDPNLVGGDPGGGAMDLAQVLARPVARPWPWAVPGTDLYLCSASTPPGGGVHGMCGHRAALAALRRSLGR